MDTSHTVVKVSPTGKSSRTAFYGIAQQDNMTIVLCQLYTGRTHQIRVHLKHMGYPIVNDPVYGSNPHGKKEIAMFGSFSEDCIVFPGKSNPSHPLLHAFLQELQTLEQSHEQKRKEAKRLEIDLKLDDSEELKGSDAWKPKRFRRSTYTKFWELENEELEKYDQQVEEQQTHADKQQEQPNLSCFEMHLHSWIYLLDSQQYKTNLPQWLLQHCSLSEVEAMYNVATRDGLLLEQQENTE